MKSPLLLVLLSVSCLALPSYRVCAQGSFNTGASGFNPISRVYAPPASPQSAATPEAALPAVPGVYNGGGTNPGSSLAYFNEPVEPNHKLNRGDRLNYRVVEDRDTKPPEALVVTDSGEVNIPLVGPMPASGKSVVELTAQVKARLEREYYYHATVIMGLDSVAPRQSRGRVYVTGAVRTEGPVELPLDEPLTVSKAIIKAGGFKEFGDRRHVKLLHKGESGKEISVDVQAVLRGKSSNDPVLQAGDTINVTEGWIHG